MAVNSWTNWGQLKEVWLGDVYPAAWYDDLTPEVRDVFYKLTEITKTDLSIIEKKLQEFGIKVIRPEYNNKDDFVNSQGHLVKPEICPRDKFLVYGNKMWGTTHLVEQLPWRSVLDNNIVNNYANGNTEAGLGPVCGANTVRVGRDVYLDIFYFESSRQRTWTAQDQMRQFQQAVASEFPSDTRLHLLSNGGHVDSCFALLKPGVILTSRYFNDYERTFPGWEQIELAQPTYAHANKAKPQGSPIVNANWALGAATLPPSFNEHVAKYALDWVGDYTETYFDVNCLVIDENNVLFLGENEPLFNKLETLGITAHSLPFRARTFWDGGLHCLTLDTVRDDSAVDLFPERTQRIYKYIND